MSPIAERDQSAVALEFAISLEDGLAVYDSEFRIVWVNPAAARLLGAKASDLCGRTHWEAVPGDSGTPLEFAYRRAMSSRETIKIEHFVGLPGNWYEIRLRPVSSDGLAAQFHDITDRKRALDELRLTSLFPAQNPHPVLRVDRDGVLRFANAAAAQLLVEWRCAIGSIVPEIVRRAIDAALAEGMPSELDVKCAESVLSFVLAPLPELGCVNLYGRDVTEHRRADAALLRLNDELEQKIAEQTSEIQNAYEAVKTERSRLQDVLDKLPVYAVLMTPDYHVPVANRFFRERFGESNGRRCYEYLFNRSEPCEVCETFTVLKTKQPHRWDWTGPDGRDYDIHDFPFTDTDGSDLIMEVGLDVTDRKRAEAEVEQSRDHLADLVTERTTQLEAAHAAAAEEKNRLLAVMEALPVGVTLLDAQGGNILSNAEFERIWSGPRPPTNSVADYAAYQAWWADTAQPVQPEEWASARAIRAGETVSGQELEIQRFDGTRTFVLNSAAPIWDSHGKLAGSAVAIMDIYDRRRAQENLRLSEQRFRGVFENAATGIAIVEIDGRFVQCNPAYYTLTGYSEDEFRQTGFPELIHPDDRAANMALIEEIRAGARSSFNIENRYVHKNGQPVWVNKIVSVLPDAAGKPTHLLALVTDVTEAKRAAAALSRARLDLDRAQAVGQIGSWRLDVKRNVLAWSDENYRIFGVPPGTPLTYESFLATIHPDDVADVNAQWMAALRGEPYDIEHRIVVDGRVKWVREKAYLELDASGALLGGFGITQDITDRKVLEEERERQARLKDEFLALLGHELRNPLAAIATAVHLVSNGVSADRKASLDELIARQVTVLQRLVDDLIDLARITHGQIELKHERLDLAEFLQKVSAAVRSPIAGRGQQLVVRMPSERVLFLADGVRLEQVAVNLLNNASKYTGHGGRIELSGAREGAEVVIRCKDNGLGIPLDRQKDIFEVFTRVHTAGQSSEAGVGIGLALVKRLVELHHGSVAVESGGAGMGSEFTVRLPLVEAPLVDPKLSRPESTRRAARTLSVVIVEDNPDVSQSLMIALEQAGHAVTVFGDGPAALAGVARLKPAAVLLDIGLPGMDGYELAVRLKKKRNFKHALFIGLSGFKRRTQAANAHDEFDHYYVKPVHPGKLLELIEQHAGKATESAPRKVARPQRVLLVEDKAELAAVTAELLAGEGLEVEVAKSGAEAIKTAARFEPEVVLCDLHLPDLPGLKVLEALRSEPAARKAYAVILTALPEFEVTVLRRQAKKMGVDQFVSKPLTREKLRELIRKQNRQR